MPLRGLARPPIPSSWLLELAAGYLLGYPSRAERRPSRWGYRFEKRLRRHRAGFFVGFLTRAPKWRGGPFATPCAPPECVVFAFLEPTAGGLRKRLVEGEGGDFRRAYDLLTKYTARWPRWEFREAQGPPLLRRVSLHEFPARQRAKYARNFFKETLALVVRSGLPAELLARPGGR